MCDDAAAQLVDVWDDARKQELAAAMVPAGDAVAAESFAVLTQGIDRYTSQWSVEWRQACASAFTQRPCLSSARARLHKLLQFLAQAGPQVLVYAPDAVAQLPDPSECAALEPALVSTGETSSDTSSDTSSELRERFADARLRYIAGPGVEEIGELVAIADEAEAAGVEDIGAHALSLAGERLGEHERWNEAQAALRRAATLTVASGDREAMVHAWSLLASTLADLGRYEEAEEKLELARGSARSVENPRARAALAHNAGLVLSEIGRIDEAVASFEQAIALNTEAYGAQHREVGVNRAALGHELYTAGRLDDARKQLDLALVVQRQASGERHPTTGIVLHWLGQLCSRAADLECAERSYAQALVVFEGTYGSEGNPTLRLLSDLADLRRQQGRLDESLALWEQIYAHGRARTHIAGSVLGEAAGNLAVIKATRGDWAGALPLAEASRDAFVGALGEEHAYVVHADTILGTILRELGRLDASLVALQSANALAASLLPVHDRERINATIELGHTRLARNEQEHAVKLAEEAIAALADPPGPAPVVVEAEFLLARALGPASERGQARARQALAIAETLGESYAGMAAAIREWLGPNAP